MAVIFTKQNMKYTKYTKPNMKYTNKRKQRIIKETDYFHYGYYTSRMQYCHLGTDTQPRNSTHKNQVLDMMFLCQNRFNKPLPARHKRLNEYSVNSQTGLHGDSLCHSTDFVTLYPPGQ